MPDKEDDDLYDAVSAMADRLHLEGRERSTYIHEHMTRGGYEAVPQYVRRDEDQDSDRQRGSGFFGSGSRDDDRRRSRGRDDRRDRDRGDNWYD